MLNILVVYVRFVLFCILLLAVSLECINLVMQLELLMFWFIFE